MSGTTILVAVALALSAAANGDTQLTPTKLLATAKSRVGGTVTVSGYFSYVVDTRALWESRSAYLDAKLQRRGSKADYWAKCITIYPRLGNVRQYNGKRVRITGEIAVIKSDDIRSFWTCNSVALENATISQE